VPVQTAKMAVNQVIVLLNGNDDRIYKEDTNIIILSKEDNKLLEKNCTILQTNFESIEDLIKAEKIIKKQLKEINELVIINKNIDLNMISYQYDYKFIKENYLILTNIFFFINLLISKFDKNIDLILSLERDSHYKIHSNIFNESIINYLNIFKKDLKESHNLNIKILD